MYELKLATVVALIFALGFSVAMMIVTKNNAILGYGWECTAQEQTKTMPTKNICIKYEMVR